MTTPSDREAEIEAVANSLWLEHEFLDMLSATEITQFVREALDSYRAENKVIPPYLQQLPGAGWYAGAPGDISIARVSHTSFVPPDTHPLFRFASDTGSIDGF